eukprot:TRINITY_DN65950_c2_g1_i1.p1 TRINITY_DN65950_c2_g1~~TRINITY_DN65950_c2_g1_i1.p1  ORF type:complete len:781 (+),score=213.35 TRINITY_DN65950_c2_g1_i1:78-2420(+)
MTKKGKKKSAESGSTQPTEKSNDDKTPQENANPAHPTDMTGLLLQYCQVNGLDPVVSCTEGENHQVPNHPEHKCTIQINNSTVSATGSTKKIARKEASNIMLRTLTGKKDNGELVAYMASLKGGGGASRKEKKPNKQQQGNQDNTTNNNNNKNKSTDQQPDATADGGGESKKSKKEKKNKNKEKSATESPPLPPANNKKGKETTDNNNTPHQKGAPPGKCLSTNIPAPHPDKPDWTLTQLNAILKARKVVGVTAVPKIEKVNGIHICRLSVTVDKVKYEAEFSSQDKAWAQNAAARDILLQLYPGRADDDDLHNYIQQDIKAWKKLNGNPSSFDPNGPRVCVAGWELDGGVANVHSGSCRVDIAYDQTTLSSDVSDNDMHTLLNEVCQLRYKANPDTTITTDTQPSSSSSQKDKKENKDQNGNNNKDTQQNTNKKGNKKRYTVTCTLLKYMPSLKGVGEASSVEVAQNLAAEDFLRKLFPARTRKSIKQSVTLERETAQLAAKLQSQPNNNRGGGMMGGGGDNKGRRGGGRNQQQQPGGGGGMMMGGRKGKGGGRGGGRGNQQQLQNGGGLGGGRQQGQGQGQGNNNNSNIGGGHQQQGGKRGGGGGAMTGGGGRRGGGRGGGGNNRGGRGGNNTNPAWLTQFQGGGGGSGGGAGSNTNNNNNNKVVGGSGNMYGGSTLYGGVGGGQLQTNTYQQQQVTTQGGGAGRGYSGRGGRGGGRAPNSWQNTNASTSDANWTGNQWDTSNLAGTTYSATTPNWGQFSPAAGVAPDWSMGAPYQAK